jgi:5'(3')-deoxyribonucleotidase
MPRKIIAIDMDEVIADALGEHLLRYNRDFAHELTEPLTRASLHGRWLWDAVPPHRIRDLERYMLSDDFFRVLPVMPHAQRVLARLQTRYNIFIASAAMEVPTSFTPKYQWLAEHFPFIPTSHIVFCGDKSILRADFLIDDNPRQLRLFQESAPTETLPSQPNPAPPTQNLSSRPEAAHFAAAAERPAVPTREGILFTSPANIHITGYRRVDSWLDVEKLFLS